MVKPHEDIADVAKAPASNKDHHGNSLNCTVQAILTLRVMSQGVGLWQVMHLHGLLVLRYFLM